MVGDNFCKTFIHRFNKAGYRCREFLGEVRGVNLRPKTLRLYLNDFGRTYSLKISPDTLQTFDSKIAQPEQILAWGGQTSCCKLAVIFLALYALMCFLFCSNG
jgi:hypothetical protein